jgi:hypothetical protein
MSRQFLLPGALALALTCIPEARAASDADVAEIRAEIRLLRQSYEARIEALEKRLAEAEARNASATPAPSPPPSGAPLATGSGASPAGASAFNPAISLVLQGNYANLSRDPGKYAIHGFAPVGETGPGRRGFSLAESELGFTASVDDRLAGNLTVALTPENTVSVEEAYGIFTAAPAGLVPKFGRFFSGIGYANEQHPHAYDFFQGPLAYDALVGGKVAQDGVQVKWLAPTEHYLELGAEVASGNDFAGTARNRNGAGRGALYAHTGGDVGESHSWRAGVSWLRTQSTGREWSVADRTGNTAMVAFDGRSDVGLVDFVWKWAPQGNAQDTNVKVQAEYLRRQERGELSYDGGGAIGLSQSAAYQSTQSGWYLQGVWQFMPRWRVGLRQDRLSTGSVDYGANGTFLTLEPFAPRRASAMVDYSPSEFSRFRAQFSRSEVQPGVTDNQFFLQYILSLGAHGAHRY